jgi:hypothetical protein
MTRRKGESRRVGFTIDQYGHPVSDARGGEWSDEARTFGRWAYLHILSRLRADVLTTLAELPYDEFGDVDADALRDWLERWKLMSTDPQDEWGAAYARGTLHGWRQYPTVRGRGWFDRDDTTGTLCPEHPPQGSRPLKDGRHFEWLAQFQTGQDWAQIGRRHGAATPAVHNRVRVLAADLGLALRRVKRGRKPNL